MDKFIAAYSFFCMHIAPYLVASLIPSIIVGLTPYPKFSPVLKALSAILNVLSFVTHKDAPGTFQAPIVSAAIRASKRPASAVALVMIMALSTVTGCAWFQAHPTVLKSVDCTISAVEAAIPTVLGDVLAALSGASPDWGALGTLEAAHGVDAVICAAQAILENGSSPDAGASKSAINMALVKNAHSYLQARGIEKK